MGAVADVQPVANIDPLAPQRINLFQQRRRVNHDAIADDRMHALAKNPGRHQRELVRRTVDDNRMARVRPSLIPHDNVVPVAQKVDDLPLRLVAPLQAHHARRTHGKSSPAYQVARFGNLVR